MTKQLVERLRSFNRSCKYKGWDGFEAEPMSSTFIENTIVNIKKYLGPFERLGIPLSCVSIIPVNAESIQFEAEWENTYLEIEVRKGD